MFYFVRNYKYIICSVCFLSATYGVLTIFRRRTLSSSKSWTVEYQIFKGKNFLNLLILIVFLLNCFMIPWHIGQSALAEISLNYAKASQGLNPNGTRYNQADILSTEVLERAIEKGALKGVTVEKLKKTLYVVPLVQGTGEDKESYFISTQFGLFYRADEDTAHINTQTLLTLVTDAYKEWFINQYSENIRVLDVDFTGIEQEDYLDICKYLKKKAESIGNYMLSMSNEEPAFKSETNGETFQSTAGKLYSVSEIMVENLKAYVLEGSISKDRITYVGRLSFQNVFLYFDALKKQKASENNLTAILMYENDMARIVLVPTYDTNDQFYMSQTRIGIDDFAAAADVNANDKADIHSQMENNNHVLQKISDLSAYDGVDEKAEILIIQIENELKKLAQEAETLVKEYSTKQANKYVTVNILTLESEIFSVVGQIFLYTVLFAVSVHLCRFAIEINRRSGKRIANHEEV